MEKRTWGIHTSYSSPTITTVSRSWKMRRAGNEACKRAMHIQKGTTLTIFDDIKADLKQIWYQDMQQIHGSIQLEVFCGNNNKVWVLRRHMNDYWLLKSNCTQHRQLVDQLISYLWTTVIKSQRKVSLQWFQYRCGETFTHSDWLHWYTPEIWGVTDNDRIESAIDFLRSSGVTVQHLNEDANYNYRLTRKQFWITRQKKTFILKNNKDKEYKDLPNEMLQQTS